MLPVSSVETTLGSSARRASTSAVPGQALPAGGQPTGGGRLGQETFAMTENVANQIGVVDAHGGQVLAHDLGVGLAAHPDPSGRSPPGRELEGDVKDGRPQLTRLQQGAVDVPEEKAADHGITVARRRRGARRLPARAQRAARGVGRPGRSLMGPVRSRRGRPSRPR